MRPKCHAAIGQRSLQAPPLKFDDWSKHDMPNNHSDGGKLGKERSNMDMERDFERDTDNG